MKIIAVVIAVVAILAGITTFILLSRPANCGLPLSRDPLIFDQPEKPDSLDPHVTFSTPGWGIVQQVYQSLVNYNGSSYTKFVPLLAKSWTVSPSGFNYTFTLRQGVHFSNNDQFNAYVMWFSLYRALVMAQKGSFILQESFWFPGLTYDSDPGESANASAWMANNLNTFGFGTTPAKDPTPAQLAVMMHWNNSFQVVDRYTIRLNMGSGYLGPVAYAYLLPAIAGPIASAVDPAVIQANGGVTNDSNQWMSSNMLGTGPHTLRTYNSATGYLLQPDATYWGRTAAVAEPWNNMIQPANSSIQVNFQTSAITAVADMKSGNLAGLSFGYVGPAQIDTLSDASCVSVTKLNVVYGSTAGGWWIYMNQQTDPFTDIHVRKAVVHAINYNKIISDAFHSYAQRWVGPVPPGYEYYNPEGLAPYPYDLALAQQEMNLSRWPLSNPYSTPINYMYVKLGVWEQVALLLKADLAKIGLNLNIVGINNIDDLYIEQGRNEAGECISQTSFAGGPFPIGQEFYTSDYISPDDWTQNNALSYGSANDCMAGYYNTTMDQLVIDAAGDTNPTNLTAYYGQMTRLMYDNYTVAWLVVPDQFQVVHTQLTGFVSNPMGAALPFVVTQNTMKAK